MNKNTWINNRAQAIINYYGESFFRGKKILDLGVGTGEFSILMSNLGAEVTAVDARKHYLDSLKNRDPKIKCVKADLDQEWPFSNQLFDITLHLGTLNHLMHIDKNLENVCSSTNYLVLDTQLCDSKDYRKVIHIKERPELHKALNGIGSRPSIAYIEHKLTNLGMEFERIKDAKLNTAPYVYDWVERGTNTYKDGLSGFWFAKRHVLVVNDDNSPKKKVSSHVNIISTIISPTVHQTVKNRGPLPADSSTINFNYAQYEEKDIVRACSKEYALIQREDFTPPTQFDVAGTILPLSVQSREWIKKISPFVPNVLVHPLAHTMRGFTTSAASANVVMCSVRNLQKHKRLWIEEWSDYTLTEQDISILQSCSVILTPSLLNAQQILEAVPSANIKRVERPWPMLDYKQEEGSYYVYFEKSKPATMAMLDAWDEANGKLYVVNSSCNLPKWAEYISDCDSYSDLCKLISNAKAVIDISKNNHYASGLQSLAKAYGVPVITNNQYRLDDKTHVLISVDKNINLLPTPQDIKKAVNKFSKLSPLRTVDEKYHRYVHDCIKKILGVPNA